MRNITQILSVGDNKVIALCDDNTVWCARYQQNDAWNDWMQLPIIPQSTSSAATGPKEEEKNK